MKKSLKFAIGMSALALASIFTGVWCVIIENNPLFIFPWFMLSIFGLTVYFFGNYSKEHQIENENSKNLFDFRECIFLVILSVMALLPYSSSLFLEYYGSLNISYVIISGMISVGMYFLLASICISQMRRQRHGGLIHDA